MVQLWGILARLMAMLVYNAAKSSEGHVPLDSGSLPQITLLNMHDRYSACFTANDTTMSMSVNYSGRKIKKKLKVATEMRQMFMGGFYGPSLEIKQKLIGDVMGNGSECTRVGSNVMKCQCISQCETYCTDVRKVKTGLYTVCDNVLISGLHVVKPEWGRECCDVDTCKGTEKRTW